MDFYAIGMLGYINLHCRQKTFQPLLILFEKLETTFYVDKLWK